MKRIDLSGKRFGSLVAKEYLGDGKWLCMCDCGRESVVLGSNLRSGHTLSCGCRRADNPLNGKRFGYLSVIERVKSPNGRDVWYRCLCDCGNECTVRSHLLIGGQTKSCSRCDAFTQDRIDALLASDTFVDGTQPCKLHSKPTKANKSGIVGVNFDKSRGKWQASIRFKGHKYNLGRFASKFEATEVRRLAEQKLFGNFLEWYEKYKQSQDTN